ncbi:MAG TPA: TRAP transporter TatT component family protein [bacterium]|nr:TRAP transporter TatT component family protein [bacterium]
MVSIAASSCMLNNLATNLTGSFLRESDPELAAQALPTFIKASEALLAGDPGNIANAVTTASLYVMYASAFLDGQAFLLPDERYDEKLSLTTRAGALYSRASAILVPLVRRRAPGIFAQARGAGALAASKAGFDKAGASRFGKADVPLLYWTSAAILAGFADSPLDFDNAARVGDALVLLDRALVLDPDYNKGALHELAFSWFASAPQSLGGDPGRAEREYSAAIAASGGVGASIYVSHALAVSVPAADYAGFRSSLNESIMVAKATPSSSDMTLLNVLAWRKARFLLDRASDYFETLPTEAGTP